jgi:hypothetical protein
MTITQEYIFSARDYPRGSSPKTNTVIVLDDGRSTPDDLHLALAFGEHLLKHRAQHSGITPPFTVSPRQPQLQPGYVRLPHLLCVRTNDGVDDRIIWEVLSLSQAEEWLGSPLPNQDYIESHLPAILAIRRHLREGQARSPAQQRVAFALSQEKRYLSILFVYQHFELFKDLLNS